MSDDEAMLRWTTSEPGVRVEATLRFADDGALELWPRVLVDDGVEPPIEITYPVLGGVQQLSELGADDVLVFPAHSGWLIRRPLSQMWPVSAPYPDGYSGCSVQFMAYIEQDAGGFYLATHDPHSTWKQFTFGSETSVRHDNWDLRAGVSMELDYPVVIAPLQRGDWFEASERYRSWVVDNAPWCPGPVKRYPGGASWLRDEVGIVDLVHARRARLEPVVPLLRRGARPPAAARRPRVGVAGDTSAHRREGRLVPGEHPSRERGGVGRATTSRRT